MEVYKYRSNYDRDISLLLNSEIYASSYIDQNDPFEGIMSLNLMNDRTLGMAEGHFILNDRESILSRYFGSMNLLEIYGIYSLSKTCESELLWAHYSNCHKGFCVEYKLDDLLEHGQKLNSFAYVIEVKYRNAPPFYSNDDFGDTDIMTKPMIYTQLGMKSTAWKYEEEIRIVFRGCGKKKISQNAVRSIIFGARATDNDINNTICQINDYMPNKIKYFKMFVGKNYNLIKNKIE